MPSVEFVEDARWFAPADPTQTGPGRVTLVGAGPGAADLLTLRAAKALGQAQMVLYDNLVSQDVLDLVPPEAQLIYVGKSASRHTLPQEAIIDLMLRLARSGRSLVRLKGGDGYIFGRGGEEALALAQAQIPFEVIPGITAAQGAGACADIPLTHRDHAATLVFATGHLRAGKDVDLDWQALSRPRQTLVIYMGIGTLPIICQQLQAHGLAADTPAALVERASLPNQRCVTGTLAQLPQLAQEHGIQAPALIIIGHVVSLHAQLQPGCQTVAPAPELQPAP